MPPNALPLGMSAGPWIAIASVLTAICLALTWRFRRQLGPGTIAYIASTVLVGLAGIIIWQLTRQGAFLSILYVSGMIGIALAAMGIFLGIVEFGILRILGLMRLGAIARITYYEALLQPFTIILLVAGVAAIGVAARLSYFTYYEDFKMFRDVASSFIFLFALPVMIFASTKVIDEEIENRTMLTLMSKPVSRTQVVIGKYLGVLTLVLVCTVILAIMASMCGYLRFYDDWGLDYRLAAGDMKIIGRLEHDNLKAFMAILPSSVLTFLQLATLAAISVAVSTRFGLAVNVAVVGLIYMGASMAKYISEAPELPAALRGVIGLLAYLLPGLSDLDLNQRLIFGNYTLGDEGWAPGQPNYGQVWQYVGLAGVYAVFYIGAVLAFGVGLFRSRELS